MVPRGPRTSTRLEALLEVVPEVLGVFKPYREANQARGDPEPLEQRGILPTVAGRGRVAEGRLDVAQTGGERDVAEAFDQAVGLVAPPDVERDHRAVAVLHQPAGELVIGVRGEAGVVDPCDAGMTLETSGQLQR